MSDPKGGFKVLYPSAGAVHGEPTYRTEGYFLFVVGNPMAVTKEGLTEFGCDILQDEKWNR